MDPIFTLFGTACAAHQRYVVFDLLLSEFDDLEFLTLYSSSGKKLNRKNY